MNTRSWFLILTLALFASSNAAAKVWTVDVGGTNSSGDGGYGGYDNPVLAFFPNQLTINAGDSVTFTNLGGAAHNVHADDNSFRCANGCDDTGGDGTASSANWTFTRTFNTPGTIHYHCDVHASMGMTGSILVNSVAASTNLSAKLTGQWYNPAQSGHGFLFEFTNTPDSVIPSQNELVVYWFVYPPAGSGQSWLFAQGAYDSTKNSVTLPVTLFEGPKFPFPMTNYDPNAFQGQSWGTLTFTFSDCNNATASWNSTLSGYGNGTMPITRLTSIPGVTCP